MSKFGSRRDSRERADPRRRPAEDPIAECIGEYGRWQFRNTLLLSLFSFSSTFNVFSSTFTAASRDFWCARPEHLSSLSVDEWKNYSQSDDSCRILNLNWSSISLSSIQNGVDPGNAPHTPCTNWEWDNSIIHSTIISDWNLVCDRQYLLTMTDLFFLLGISVGGIVSGIVSDRFGRVNTLMACHTFYTLSAIITYYCEHLELYFIIKFIIGFGIISVINSGFILALELVGGKWTTIVGICNFIPLPISYILASSISMLFPHWKYFQLALLLPGVLLIGLWWVLPESPRWLQSIGKVDALRTVLKEAAAENKRKLPNNFENIIIPRHTRTELEHKTVIADLFRDKMYKITLVSCFAWFTCTLCYYGIVLRIGSLGGDLHMTSILSGVVEIPALALSIPLLMRYGRRYPIGMAMILSGAFYLISIFFSDDYALSTKLTFAMLGKFGAGIANGVFPMLTAELFPTLIRTLGLGSGQFSAGVALLCIPYIWELGALNAQIPMGIIGSFTIAGGLSIFLLPETGNKPLIDAIKGEVLLLEKPIQSFGN